MGVTGLWRLIEPAGKPVPVETLENKVLAVDISIWLHQMVKGYQDAKGAPLPNAHLMGLFQRLCKLLYFRIKPVFVFDGAFPELKKETIAKRQDHKAKYNSESERIKRELALLLSKKTAVNSLLGKQISPGKQHTAANNDNDDLFKLPALPQREEESESESEDEQNTSGSSIDLHSVDLESDTFKNLPTKEKYDILIDLKETRKQNSWGRLQELPKKSDNFSDFQLQRLLKRRKVQECLQETEKEMGDCGMSLNDLECLLNEEGIETKIDTIPTRRIASNVTSRFLLIKDVKQALANAKKKEEENKAGPSGVKITEIVETKEEPVKDEIIELNDNFERVDELEDDLQKAIKMSLECVDESTTNVDKPNDVDKQTTSGDKQTAKPDDSWTSCMTDTDSEFSGTDSEEEDGFAEPDLSCAKAYIMQYSDFTHSAIDQLVTDKRKGKTKKLPTIDDVLEEIYKEKSIIVDNVELSSDEECVKENKTAENGKPIHEESNIHEKLDDSLDATQASVVCINPTPEVINLDTSTEDFTNTIEPQEKIEVKKELEFSDNDFEEVESNKSKEDTDSSDNDFEEVSDEETKVAKPVFELTLNVGDVPEDDIFADVFNDSKDVLKPSETNSDKKVMKEVTENVKPFDDFKMPKTVSNIMVNDKAPVTVSLPKAPVDVPKVPVELPNKPQVEAKNYIGKEVDKPEVTSKLPDDQVQTDNSNDNIIQTNVSSKSNELPNSATKTTKQSLEEIMSKPDPAKEVISVEKLNTMVEEIQNQEDDLIQEKGRLDRVGRNITEQMTKEAQELLQIFGIPYIVAPMEAEAQCAFLESAKLTDGTITDDSDIWLFGGRTVYKNFFNQKKHVLQFQAERIETSFNLNREQLILLALLVGSDYTTGVAGVGPVTAMEILASFPFNKRQLLCETTKQARYALMIKGLQEFKQWVKAGRRTDNISLKKKLKNVALTEDFPSVRVVQAYLDPNVEKSEDKFSWGEIDITILRDYTKTKFGWSQNKLDEIIKPVLKRIVERKTQRSMQDFFKRKIEFQSLEDQMSKRVKAAVQRMGPDNGAAVDTLEVATEKVEIGKPATKRKAAKSGPKSKAGPSAPKQKKTEVNVLLNQGVKVVSVEAENGKSEIDIKIHKTDRFQEIIPQREKDKQGLLQNKLKAIELFRKTKLDKPRKTVKRKGLIPKDKAELSESDSD